MSPSLLTESTSATLERTTLDSSITSIDPRANRDGGLTLFNPHYLYPDTDGRDLFSAHESGEGVPNIEPKIFEKLREAYDPSPPSPLPLGEGGAKAKLPDDILQLC